MHTAILCTSALVGYKMKPQPCTPSSHKHPDSQQQQQRRLAVSYRMWPGSLRRRTILQTAEKEADVTAATTAKRSMAGTVSHVGRMGESPCEPSTYPFEANRKGGQVRCLRAPEATDTGPCPSCKPGPRPDSVGPPRVTRSSLLPSGGFGGAPVGDRLSLMWWHNIKVTSSWQGRNPRRPHIHLPWKGISLLPRQAHPEYASARQPLHVPPLEMMILLLTRQVHVECACSM